MGTITAKGKSKVIKKGAGNFAKGGSGHMIGKQHAGLSAPSVTGKKDSSAGGKFAKGGNGHMISGQSANPKAPGKTGK